MANDNSGDINVATMPDEAELFFCASFDGVHSSNTTGRSRTPFTLADLLYLPFVHPSASSCHLQPPVRRPSHLLTRSCRPSGAGSCSTIGPMVGTTRVEQLRAIVGRGGTLSFLSCKACRRRRSAWVSAPTALVRPVLHYCIVKSVVWVVIYAYKGLCIIIRRHRRAQ